MAVEEVFGGEVIWHCESDAAASKVLAHHWAGVDNVGDIVKANWNELATTSPVDVICGGFPCTDLSLAGKRAGLNSETRSGLWAEMARIVGLFRPRWVVIENVRGLFSAEADCDLESTEPDLGDRPARPVLRALGAVLGDLADLGYDAQWATVAASDIGAAHRRERVFILASHPGGDGCRRRPQCHLKPPAGIAAPQRDDAYGCVVADGGAHRRAQVDLLPTPTSRDHKGRNQRDDQTCLPGALERADQWGKYAPAISRWESLTRPAPEPAELSRNGKPRLNAAFSEWLMGWPAGWVTNPAIGISRNDQLRILGNGVVPAQASAALRYLINIKEEQ
jgi:DNA (cytosine-5)-methyltransferase 1